MMANIDRHIANNISAPYPEILQQAPSKGANFGSRMGKASQ